MIVYLRDGQCLDSFDATIGLEWVSGSETWDPVLARVWTANSCHDIDKVMGVDTKVRSPLLSDLALRCAAPDRRFTMIRGEFIWVSNLFEADRPPPGKNMAPEMVDVFSVVSLGYVPVRRLDEARRELDQLCSMGLVRVDHDYAHLTVTGIELAEQLDLLLEE